MGKGESMSNIMEKLEAEYLAHGWIKVISPHGNTEFEKEARPSLFTLKSRKLLMAHLNQQNPRMIKITKKPK